MPKRSREEFESGFTKEEEYILALKYYGRNLTSVPAELRQYFLYSPFKVMEVIYSIYLADSFNIKMNIFMDLIISSLFPLYIGLFILYNLIFENVIV